jgi:stearoyl-CoA desaturase (Delta-9 desaturase)
MNIFANTYHHGDVVATSYWLVGWLVGWFVCFFPFYFSYFSLALEFPKDYRNAIKFWQYDPTKWTIRTLAFFGLTYNLHEFPDNEVRKGRLQMEQKHLEEEKAELDWGREFDELPTYSWGEIRARQETTGELWMVIGGAVHDVTKWVNDHPGGPGFIRSFVGKDRYVWEVWV